MKYLYFLLFLFIFPLHADDIGSQFQQQAQAGDPQAQYLLADTYYSSGDEQKAHYWAEKAAQNGNADAIALLAQMSLKKNVAGAKTLAEQASVAGSKNGDIILARILVNSEAGKPDYPRAITLLENVAQDIESDAAVDAQMLLGLIYANGGPTPEDDAKATGYFKRSSTLSRTGYAEYWAGMMFLQGEKGFITPNKQKALQWLNLSCMEGFDTGCEEFDRLSNE
jgi:TPR repeat protein